MSWEKPDLKNMQELRDNLQKLKTLLHAQKAKEIEKMEKVIDVFDLQTQDAIRKAVDVGKLEQP